MSQTIDAFAVVDADSGLMYETIARSAIDALKSMPVARGDDVLPSARMMAGKLRVHKVQITLRGAVDPETERDLGP